MFVTLATHVDIVHVGGLLLIGSNRNGGGDGGLGHLLHFDTPLILWLFEIGESKLRLPI
jgi:hypothetical protein